MPQDGTPAGALAGERVLVTGAARRIGRAIARDLASAGAAVAVHVHGSVEEGEALVRELGELGSPGALVVADQRDVDAVEDAVRTAEEVLGPLTGLVNSAAVWPHTALEETTQEDFDLALEVNCADRSSSRELLAVR